MASPAAQPKELKTCSKCGKGQTSDLFRLGANGKAKRICRECEREGARAWKKANPERTRELKRKSWARHRDRLNAKRRAERDETVLERERRWRGANAEKLRSQLREYRAAHPEKVREWRRRWAEKDGGEWRRQRYAKDPSPFLARNHMRRMGEGAYGPDLAAAIAVLRLEPCAYCGATDNIEIDHIVPLSRGGTNAIENLAPACRPCNRSKFNRTPDEWNGRKV